MVYLYTLIVKVRDGAHVANRSAHIAVGVDIDGIKHVLGIWVQATKGAKCGAGVHVNLANRGVRDMLIVCCDGLTSSVEGDHRNLALRHDPDVCGAPDPFLDAVRGPPGPQIRSLQR